MEELEISGYDVKRLVDKYDASLPEWELALMFSISKSSIERWYLK